MKRAKRTSSTLTLNEPGYVPSKIEASGIGTMGVNRWPWDMAVLSPSKLLAFTGTPSPKGFDPLQLFVRLNALLTERATDGNPFANLRFPDTPIGRAEHHLVNAIFAMSDDAVANCCWEMGCRDEIAIAGFKWDITRRAVCVHYSTGSDFTPWRILQGAASWLADQARLCWKIPFDDWPNQWGPKGRPIGASVFMFRRDPMKRFVPTFHSSMQHGEHWGEKWADQFDLPMIAEESDELAAQIDAWKARHVITLLNETHDQHAESLQQAFVDGRFETTNPVFELGGRPTRDNARAAVRFLNGLHKRIQSCLSDPSLQTEAPNAPVDTTSVPFATLSKPSRVFLETLHKKPAIDFESRMTAKMVSQKCDNKDLTPDQIYREVSTLKGLGLIDQKSAGPDSGYWLLPKGLNLLKSRTLPQ